MQPTSAISVSHAAKANVRKKAQNLFVKWYIYREKPVKRLMIFNETGLSGKGF